LIEKGGRAEEGEDAGGVGGHADGGQLHAALRHEGEEVHVQLQVPGEHAEVRVRGRPVTRRNLPVKKGL